MNKVETKVRATLDVAACTTLRIEQKIALTRNLGTKLTDGRFLSTTCTETRSQSTNKERAVQKLIALVRKGLVTRKKRIATAIPTSVHNERLRSKRALSSIKLNRKRPETDPS